jgi:hypothetical protein
MVTEVFSPLKTDGAPRLAYDKLGPAIETADFHQLVYIQPVKDKQEVEIACTVSAF